MIKEDPDPMGMPEIVKPTGIFPQGHLSGLNADTVDGKHADELGGVADHSVTMEKLYPPDGTAGQILSNDGDDLVWIDPTSGGMDKATYDPANISEQLVGIDATQEISNKTLDNPIVSGNLLVGKLDDYRITAPLDGSYVHEDPQHQALNNPFPGIWHDVLAFGELYSPVYETSPDGTSWSTGQIDLRLFDHREKYTVDVADGKYIKASRWTWSGVTYNYATWMMLGFTFTSPTPNVTIILESSSDNSTWTQISSHTFNINVEPYWLYTGLMNVAYFRLTVVYNSGGKVLMSAIKWLSDRYGDQGEGEWLSSPIEWDENKNVTFKNALLPVYPNNTAATNDGLKPGEFYRTGGDPDLVCVVH